MYQRLTDILQSLGFEVSIRIYANTMWYLQWVVEEPQCPDDEQQSPYPQPLHLYLLVPPPINKLSAATTGITSMVDLQVPSGEGSVLVQVPKAAWHPAVAVAISVCQPELFEATYSDL